MLAAKYACCFYPTEVVFVDNNPTYLETLESILGTRQKGIAFKFFSNPKDALNHIEKAPAQTFVDRLMKRVETFQVDRHSINIDIGLLYEELYNVDRFKQVSVVVVDYELDGIDGLTFCRQISKKNVQKVLLTTKSEDSSVAIDAFNQGLIRHFISKQQLTSISELMEIIKKAQSDHFFQLSQIIYETVRENKNFPLAICHTAFAKFFETFLKKHNIFEYYLFDIIGSCVLVNDKGEVKSLFVQNLDQHEATLLEIEDEIGQSISALMGEKIKAGKSIFCYPTLKDQKIPVITEWHKYFYDAMPILDTNNKTFFYCALVEKFPFLDLTKLTTFDRYRKQVK